MKSILKKLLASALFAIATAAPAHGQTTPALGQVQGVYVRITEGVYREATSEDLKKGETLYADLWFADAAATGRRYAMVRVDRNVRVDNGDLLDARVVPESDRFSPGVGALPPEDRMVAIRAKYYTPTAMSYGKRSFFGRLVNESLSPAL